MLRPNHDSVKHLIPWLLISLLFPLVFLNGWLAYRLLQYFQPLISIFVLVGLLTFILNHPVQFLQKQGLKRHYAVLLVFFGTGITALTLGVTLLPIIVEDMGELASLIPQWIGTGLAHLQGVQNWVDSHQLPLSLDDRLISQLSDRLPEQIESFSNTAATLVIDAFSSLSIIVLTSVLTLYLLFDGERLADAIFDRLPARFAPQLKYSLQKNFQGYFIGQATLSILVGLVLSTTFVLLQVPYALLLGILAGLLTLIPFADLLTYSLIGGLMATQSLWLGIKVFVVAIAVDQLIDQVVAPRILGSFTGLKPIWVLIALLIGAKIAGILGLIVAVPVASVIQDAFDGFPSDHTPEHSQELDKQPEWLSQGLKGDTSLKP